MEEMLFLQELPEELVHNKESYTAHFFKRENLI